MLKNVITKQKEYEGPSDDIHTTTGKICHSYFYITDTKITLQTVKIEEYVNKYC